MESQSPRLSEAIDALLPDSGVEMVLGVQRSILQRLKTTHSQLREQNQAMEAAIASLRASGPLADLADTRKNVDSAYALLRCVGFSRACVLCLAREEAWRCFVGCSCHCKSTPTRRELERD